MKKISHEVPLCLLQKNLEWSDYQYVLPHLIDKHVEYKDFILNYRKQESSFIMMDNGLFEGINHTEQDLIEKINLVEPDVFIVPDTWNDKNETLKNAKYWMDVVKPKLSSKTQLMVVMQGVSISDFFELYQTCEDIGYNHFAFNHSSKYYQLISRNSNKLINQMCGRHQLINIMANADYIRDSHYIHLLGCSLPQEFLLYKDPSYDFIKSIDTSSPIINGALQGFYEEWGSLNKPFNKIDEFMEQDLNNKIDIIDHNVYKLKEFIN
jgi:hypothetical protein